MRFNHTILQVIPRLDAGGAERSTVEIADAIVRAGGRALVATAGGRLAQEIEKAGGEIIELPVHSKNPAVIWNNGGRLARLARKRGVEVIHARSRAPAWSALAAARRLGAPFVTTYHGAYEARSQLKRLYNSSMLRADCVIANSRFTAAAIERAGEIDPRKIRIIPRGADLRFFDPRTVDEGRINHILSDWGEIGEKSAFKVLLPARMAAWKGHEVAIEAAALLKSRNPALADSGQKPGLTLVFCGDAQGRGDYKETLRALSDERGVRNMVHLVGDCADMPAAYGWSDVVIAPSTRPEAFGRVVVEAGAMGKPVIAANHGGACETVIEGETGYLVEPGDAAALADRIEKLWRMSPEERLILGENGMARASSVYSAAAMCDATLRVYSNLLAEKNKTAAA